MGVLEAMSTARSVSDIAENVAFAELDEGLFELLQSPEPVNALGDTISEYWLDRGLEDLRTVVSVSSEISSYEHEIRVGNITSASAPPPAFVRDPAFRRVVTKLYDYRCAATGLRVIVSGEAMVEAAHIHPFSVTGDDDPRNGLALSPNMHWAMDRNFIAPGPDLKWHVSPALDSRIPDFAQLVSLEGKPLFLPREPRFAPKRESLDWRFAKLRGRHETPTSSDPPPLDM